MSDLKDLRRWFSDPEIAHAGNIGPASWTYDRPERAILDKARDAAAMLNSFIELQESAMMYRDSDENGDIEEQVSIEAAQLALQYCEELLKMAHEAKGDEK